MHRIWFAVLALLAGCPGGEDTPPACVTVDTSCAPLYTPTFANVYNNTLRNGCGSALSACHSASGAGAMSLATPDIAYQSLLNGHVTIGDPGCSEIIVRTHGLGKDYLMPPGTPISEGERCALVQWVAAGAPGPVTTTVEAAR